jgi:transaldolase
MPNKLEQLKTMTDVVADTGDIEAMREYQPLDATTNPSLLLKASALPHYAELMQKAVNYASGIDTSRDVQIAMAADRFAVDIGCEIMQLIPGRVSTEVDARLSFDTRATINKARQLIKAYYDRGIDNDRILIKIAATWEGIRAAEVLEREGIHCNLTLLFGFCQAVACAEAGATLISPFVGRILDWYKQDTGRDHYESEEDPGVLSVTRIFNYYKHHGYDTIVMGASFRNTGEIEQLAGCDRLTISPQLLEALQQDPGHLPRQLDPTHLSGEEPRVSFDEPAFRWALNEDAMATAKLAEGIRNFAADQRALEQKLAELLSA